MPNSSKVTVKNDSETPVPTEVIAESIVAIAEGVKKLRSTRLNDTALFLLIQHSSPTIEVGNNRMKVGIREVRAVIEGIADLEKNFLRSAK